MNYKTKQKNKILEIIENRKNEFTIKEVYEELNQSVGLTTIYRLVNKLINEKKLNKEIGKDNLNYYQYLNICNNKNHFYLKCNKCLKLIHVDCDCINDIENHVLEKHKFYMNKENIIINGICNKCRRNG